MTEGKMENNEDRMDSLTIGTPKEGAIKIYSDYSKPEEFKNKIIAAIELRKFAHDKLYGEKTE